MPTENAAPKLPSEQYYETLFTNPVVWPSVVGRAEDLMDAAIQARVLGNDVLLDQILGQMKMFSAAFDRYAQRCIAARGDRD